jgi:hypothetical protein
MVCRLSSVVLIFNLFLSSSFFFQYGKSRNSWKKRSRDILSKQVKMATFNGSEAAAGNDELYLAS